jgi:predicted TIM-barrel fold metal-dependent hydrolase
MEIVDAQIHEPHPVVAWADGDPEPQRERNVELALSAMDAVGVDAAVLHATEDFANTAHRLQPDRFMGMVDVGDPLNIPDVDGTVKRFADNPAVAGFRVVPCNPPDGPNVQALKDGEYEPWFVAAEKYGVPIVVFLLENLPLGAKIAREHPNMTLVIDQCGFAAIPYYPLVPDRLSKLPELLDLANFSNVAMKFVGFTCLSYEEYPFRDLWTTLDDIVDAFGAERLMWGADHTRLMMTGPRSSAGNPGRGRPWRTYADDLNFVRLHEKLSDSAKELMLGQALRKLYCWPKN